MTWVLAAIAIAAIGMWLWTDQDWANDRATWAKALADEKAAHLETRHKYCTALGRIISLELDRRPDSEAMWHELDNWGTP